MIFDTLITGIFALITTVLGVLPSLPAIPTDITTPMESFFTFVHDGAAILDMVLTTPLLTAAILVIAGTLAFEQIYHGVMWLVRKIPMINMK
jgi:hypothetical protein